MVEKSPLPCAGDAGHLPVNKVLDKKRRIIKRGGE
jgi:hypothetical protein